MGSPFCLGSAVIPENSFLSVRSLATVLSAATSSFVLLFTFFRFSDRFGFFSLLFSRRFCRASRAFLFSGGTRSHMGENRKRMEQMKKTRREEKRKIGEKRGKEEMRKG